MKIKFKFFLIYNKGLTGFTEVIKRNKIINIINTIVFPIFLMHHIDKRSKVSQKQMSTENDGIKKTGRQKIDQNHPHQLPENELYYNKTPFRIKGQNGVEQDESQFPLLSPILLYFKAQFNHVQRILYIFTHVPYEGMKARAHLIFIT